MIVARAGGALRVVSQVAHQEQCGILMAAWGNDRFARPAPWHPVVAAAAWHDEGWREWERHPALMPDGRPRGFAEMELGEHVAIHRQSAARARWLGDHAALLVGMHGAGLVMRRLGIDAPMPALDGVPAEARGLVIDAARGGRDLRRALGEGPALAGWAWAAYRLMQAVDLLSLYLTWRGLEAGERWTLDRVPRSPGDEPGVTLRVSPGGDRACIVDPWPFADAVVRAPVAARFIDDRRHRDGDDLAAALAAAPEEVIDFAVLPASART